MEGTKSAAKCHALLLLWLFIHAARTTFFSRHLQRAHAVLSKLFVPHDFFHANSYSTKRSFAIICLFVHPASGFPRSLCIFKYVYILLGFLRLDCWFFSLSLSLFEARTPLPSCGHVCVCVHCALVHDAFARTVAFLSGYKNTFNPLNYKPFERINATQSRSFLPTLFVVMHFIWIIQWNIFLFSVCTLVCSSVCGFAAYFLPHNRSTCSLLRLLCAKNSPDTNTLMPKIFHIAAYRCRHIAHCHIVAVVA